MGEVQEIAPNRDAGDQGRPAYRQQSGGLRTLGDQGDAGIGAPGDHGGEIEAFAQMGKAYNALDLTRDFQEGRDAEAQNRPPVYIGK